MLRNKINQKATKKMSLLVLTTVFFISIVYLETVLRLFTTAVRQSAGLVYSPLFGAVFALCLGIASSLSGRKFIPSAFLLILGFIFASQLVYYKIFRTFYIVYSAGNAGKVMEFANEALYNIWINLHLILLMFLPSVIFIASAKSRVIERPEITQLLLFLTVAVIIHMIGVSSLNRGDKDVNSPYNLYYNIHHPGMSVDNLGLLTYMRLDLKRSLIGWEPKELGSGNAIIVIPKKVSVRPDKDVEEEAIYGPNTLDIDFEELAIQETDPQLKKLHTYFSAVEPTTKNRFTGMFKGYNLILLTAESFSHLGIDPQVTPTLYKMYNDGFRFENFYTALWGVSTSDGEYAATTGLIPKSGVWSYRHSKDNLLPFTMGNQLKKQGYITKAYHNHSYDYYDRHLSHPNAGYDYKGIGNGLNVTKTWPESDLEMMELTLPEFIGDKPFHTYYMTVSGHMRYTFGGNFIANKNKELVKDLPYPEGSKAYLATQIELDKALEFLLSELERAGLAERTLFALSTDHYPYALAKNDLDALAGHEIEETFELYKNSFILYAKGMEPLTIDKPGSSLDILPTISNLMGLEFDSRLLMGRDLLSDSEPLVILYDRSFITDKGRYSSRTGKFEAKGDFADEEKSIQEDYRKNISAVVEEKFYYSAKILELDYYRAIMGQR